MASPRAGSIANPSFDPIRPRTQRLRLGRALARVRFFSQIQGAVAPPVVDESFASSCLSDLDARRMREREKGACARVRVCGHGPLF